MGAYQATDDDFGISRRWTLTRSWFDGRLDGSCGFFDASNRHSSCGLWLGGLATAGFALRFVTGINDGLKRLI